MKQFALAIPLLLWITFVHAQIPETGPAASSHVFGTTIFVLVVLAFAFFVGYMLWRSERSTRRK